MVTSVRSQEVGTMDEATHGGEVLAVLRTRRSQSRLVDPAPDAEALAVLLTAAGCAPDHGRLRPWRFIRIAGDALDRFGEVLVDAYVRRCTSAGLEVDAARLDKERTKSRRAPLLLVAAAVRRSSDKIPWDEQRSAVAAAVQNILLAATALGYGSMWRTGDPAYDSNVKRAIGLSADDAIVGFIYLGTRPGPSTSDAMTRAPEPAELVEWTHPVTASKPEVGSGRPAGAPS